MTEPPPSSSQVHTHELNGFTIGDSDVRYEPSAYERFRHSGWKHKRELVYSVLKDAGTTQAGLDRYAQCGCCCQVNYSPAQKRLYLNCSACKNRFCEPCSRARRATIAGNLAAFCGEKQLRMITLTIAHHERPLSDLISRMNTSFKLMRKEIEWKSHITGFASFLEIKWSERSKWWHVHMHILCEGQWWDSKLLSACWHKVTGDSFVTDIRQVDTREGITYAAKYASKPFDLCSIPAEQRVTAVQSLRHRRLWLIGGSWKGATRLIATTPLPDDLVVLGSFREILHRSHQGDPAAERIIEAIVGGQTTEIIQPVDLDFSGP